MADEGSRFKIARILWPTNLTSQLWVPEALTNGKTSFTWLLIRKRHSEPVISRSTLFQWAPSNLSLGKYKMQKQFRLRLPSIGEP
ncbi:hypothetical protein MUK42_31524 [Musa troglodytarum]|uniref:Uncharacterized protein n=1 Tax=Musa troglodytarum TaxID=320322 RepID=A0A9E7FGZ6_9LILI|nr:hypothetical protein MUK42_31524 [Musa troglodytarum]